MHRSTFISLLPILILTAALHSCGHTRQTNLTLKAADSLMSTSPQAALDSLISIDSISLAQMGRKDGAYYQLLLTEAHYKCYLPINADTAIFKATGYFRKHGPGLLYARALIMQGALLTERNAHADALISYKKAEPVLTDVQDYEQLGLLYTRIGELYQTTFSEKKQSLLYYRKALSLFRQAHADHRLAAANLTLSRILLIDSAAAGRTYFEEGFKKAATDHDTTLILEGLDQKALYLIACTHDSLAAARTAANAMRTPEYAGYLTKSQHNSLCMIAAEGYSAAGRADSALFFVDKMILSGTSDSALYYWTLSTAKQYSGEFKKALEYEKKASELSHRLKTYSNNLNLELKEQSYQAEYNSMAAKYRISKLINTILILTAAACILIFFLVKAILYLKRTHTNVRKSIKLIHDHTGINPDAAQEDDDIRLLNLVKTILNKKQHSSGADSFYATMLNLIDILLTSYCKFSNGDVFRRQCTDLIQFHLSSNSLARTDITKMVKNIYPQLLENIQKDFPDLTDRDLEIIAMTACGFSNYSISIITGNKPETVMAYKSRIAAKMKIKVRLSSYLKQELQKSFQ